MVNKKFYVGAAFGIFMALLATDASAAKRATCAGTGGEPRWSNTPNPQGGRLRCIQTTDVVVETRDPFDCGQWPSARAVNGECRVGGNTYGAYLGAPGCGRDGKFTRNGNKCERKERRETEVDAKLVDNY